MKTYEKILIILMWGVLVAQLAHIRPQLKEERVAVQTVKLDGHMYVCGTVLDNQDPKSLYCSGFTDGYSWAVAQLKMSENY